MILDSVSQSSIRFDLSHSLYGQKAIYEDVPHLQIIKQSCDYAYAIRDLVNWRKGFGSPHLIF